MRRLWPCVLMISLLLTGCAGGGGVSKAEQLALNIRGEYLAGTCCEGTASLTADYGKRVYQYEMNFSDTPEEFSLTITAPETVAGITARMDEESNGLLEYEDVILETGPMDEDGLTPAASIPHMLRELREGYLDQCALEGNGALRVLFRDPERLPGEGRETTLWLDPATHLLLRGEISRDGFTVIQCDFSTFTKNNNQ